MYTCIYYLRMTWKLENIHGNTHFQVICRIPLVSGVYIYIYIYIWYPPQMSTSFGFDWYLQCFMHNFEYNNLTKNKTRPNSKNNKYKETHKTHIHRFEYLMFGFTIAPTFAFRKYECSFHTVLSTKSKNSVCKRSQTRGDSRFKIQFLNPVFQT